MDVALPPLRLAETAGQGGFELVCGVDPDRLPGAWRLARHPSTREAVTTAEVLVAVDQAAIPAVWWAARRRARRGRPPLAALSGVPAAQNRLTLPPS